MSIKNSKNIKVIVPATLAVIVISYLGLSSYASTQAEERLTTFITENNLEDSISWKSVSASPLGATVTINKVKVENENLLPVELLINKVVIKDFNDDNHNNSANILLSKIQPIDDENEFGQYYHNEIFGMVKAVNEGKAITPYDLQLHWHYLAKDKSLKFGVKANAPDITDAEFEAEFENVADIASLSQAKYMHPTFSMIPDMSSGRDRYDTQAAQNFERVKVKYLAVKFKDQGYLERINTLEGRYNLPVLPSKGDVEKQRKTLAIERSKVAIVDCEKNISEIYNDYKKACSALIGTWFSQEKGFHIVADPKNPVSLSVFDKLGSNNRSDKKIINDFNISIKTL
ncbi:hypothetical protein [Oceanisphaera avium]|uniref:Uncharacterized protein n=1 Tax=Oceanisphaera avium TaxID=1903694 RepID=A0A1Y0CXB6_9GAMM|nr:hypothetical protein [Oceanisphaera avium]ART79654.1 hypothetical protein CBP12_05380 [Oceanisphaera avium]